MVLHTPVIGLAGQSGVGKDEVGLFLQRTYNAATLGQADPIKYFLQAVFEFSNDQLWGDQKNEDDPRYSLDINDRLQRLEQNYRNAISPWMRNILPTLGTPEFDDARETFDDWFYGVLRSLPGPVSPRKLLQKLGTEVGRAIDQDVWASYARRVGRKLLLGGYRYERESGLMRSHLPPPDYVVTCDLRFLSEVLSIRENNGAVFKVSRPTTQVVGYAGHSSEAELGGIKDHFYTAVLQNTGTLEQLYDRVARQMVMLYGDGRGAGFLL